MTANPKSTIPNPQSPDPLLPGRLYDLATMANHFGAEGIWLIRGARDTRLVYTYGETVPIHVGDVPATSSLGINLDLADAGVLVLIRFPASDGEEPGIESK